MDTLAKQSKRPTRKRPPSKGEALRRANVLLEVSRRCAAMQTLDGLLEVLVEMTSRELDCDRGTLFLNDPESSELYSRVAQGNLSREIRILNNTGFAGHAFQNEEAIVSHDAYADERFNPSVDERTGYRTESIICVPIRTLSGEIIGVMQCLNKRNGSFTFEDLDLLSEMTSQAAIALQSRQYVEQIDRIRIKETAFLELVSEINSEFDLNSILQRLVAETTKMLDAERATIFLHDPGTGTLFSRVLTGSDISEIRFP
jgi:adenylate cyclase